MTRSFVVSLVSLVFAACSSSKPPPPVLMAKSSASAEDSRSRGPAPDWVLRTPRQSGNICAVGTVDPTFFRQDGVRFAADAARNELARTIEVKVTSVMYDEQTIRGSHVDEAFVQQVVGTMSDVVLSGAQVLESWFDELGSISRRGMTYALACMATDQTVAELAERLKAAGGEGEESADRIADVRERAADLFKELEEQEERRLATPEG
jgi:hypothetical protein